jgi:hypothetical protein
MVRDFKGEVMQFLRNKGGELVKLAVQAGVKIDEECQFAFLPEHVARMCSAQVQRWAVEADDFEADAYVNEFTPAGDLSTRSEQVIFTLNPQFWLHMMSEFVAIAETDGTYIVDMAELDDLLWCEALRCEYGDETGVMAGHGFNLALMLKHEPQKFLSVCQEAAIKHTMVTAEKVFDAAVGEWLEWLEGMNYGN